MYVKTTMQSNVYKSFKKIIFHFILKVISKFICKTVNNRFVLISKLSIDRYRSKAQKG